MPRTIDSHPMEEDVPLLTDSNRVGTRRRVNNKGMRHARQGEQRAHGGSETGRESAQKSVWPGRRHRSQDTKGRAGGSRPAGEPLTTEPIESYSVGTVL